MKRQFCDLTILIHILALGFVHAQGTTSSRFGGAIQKGAKAQLTFRVVDDQGLPVHNAHVFAGFYNPRTHGDRCEGNTDTNGLYTATGVCAQDMTYTITKDGYYKTTGRYLFTDKAEQPVIDGRWQPWNPTIAVTLKPIKNPAPMYARNVDIIIPVKDVSLGLDLEAGDWVAPNGKGQQPDLFFTYGSVIIDPLTFSNHLVIACGKTNNGFRLMTKDEYSDLWSLFEAPMDGYQSMINLCINRTDLQIIERNELGNSEYLIFRSRSMVDDKGIITSARYGKIYGPIQYGEADNNRGGIRFTYYFNPTPNDRNLEFDPKRNLLPPLDPHDKVPRP